MFQSLCNLEAGGEKMLVLARDVQLDPVTDIVLHVDFLRVTPKTQIRVRVPVHYNNVDEAPGSIAGGVLNIVKHDLEVVCSATNIPEAIEVDLSKMELGDAVHINDVKFPANVKPTDKPKFTIVTLNEPRRMEIEETPAAEGEAAEGAEGAAAAEGEAKEEEK
jgi:large subunit ribosomal protein L25